MEVPQIDDGTDRKRAEIATLADESPAEMAELLRGWMAGSGSGTGTAR